MSQSFQTEKLGKSPSQVEELDLEKLLFILRKSLVWIGLIFVVLLVGAYLMFVRWSKPLYESESILKLDFESEANTLGLGSEMSGLKLNELSGEIELLKSNLFFSKVVDEVGMDVSYFFYGNFLEDERYTNSPFVVSYKIKNEGFFDKPIDLTIEDANNFLLSYTYGTEVYRIQRRFGEPIETPNFNFLIEKSTYFKNDDRGRYYFMINSRQGLLRYFQSRVEVQPVNFNAKTIRISLSDHNKYKARDLVQAIDTLYLEYTKAVKNQAIEQKISFLQNQIESTQSKLEDFENYFETFTITNKTTNLERDIAKTIVQLDLLDSQRFRLKNQLSDLSVLSNQINSENTRVLPQIGVTSWPETIKRKLEEYQTLKIERQRKLGSYSANTYVIKQVDQQIELLEEELSKILADYKVDLKDMLAEVNRRRAYLEGSFVELPSMGTEFNKNRRLYQLQEEFLLALRKSKMELEITRAGTVTKSVILSPASIPSVPIKPKPFMIYGVAFSAALALSIVFVLIRYLLHNNITSLRELERLVNVPILGSIPEYQSEKLKVTKMIIQPNSKSAISEALRTIRTNMEFFNGAKGSHIVTVTSTVSGEGKTFIGVNLAAVIAFSNQKVCVVDLDMRKPKVHLAFDDSESPAGVSTYLIGKDKIKDCIKKSPIDHLDYIPAGPIPPNPSELILNERYKEMLDHLSKQYDLVVLDTPPVGLVTDAVLSMKNSDIQFYVLRSDYSKRAYLKTLETLQKMNNFTNLGVIFNSVKNSGSHGYGYGYGYYEDSDKS
ncbi:polysaccharide biosynthesis tyrosine autokinase [Marinoscillum sp. MHG1-6]|uniref:GumC family protein n=1 Tax=Marinoscillum sp. MHG1-6 TaxID=2959627 RepID=UPI0021581BC2|nr:polysaccharide biosynthesis tyrosine autokinase [Marinoscillum sp. MHG1-6]